MFALRLALLSALLVVPPALAQDHAAHMNHMGAMAPVATPIGQPREAGQSAFAALQEIAEILEADPATDWTRVDLEALRQHLIDMDAVTLRAEVKSEAIDGGMRFTVSGAGPVAASIRRMALAHAATMTGTGGWSYEATATETGAIFTVRTPPQDAARLRGLGFVGVMTRGMHHQAHHLTIARGGHPHP